MQHKINILVDPPCRHPWNAATYSDAQGFIGGGGTGEGRLPPWKLAAPPPLRLATIYIHNIESSPLIDIKCCLKQTVLLTSTHEILSASCSGQEGAHPPPPPTPTSWY